MVEGEGVVRDGYGDGDRDGDMGGREIWKKGGMSGVFVVI